jgi:hypothetical protein
MIHNDVMDDMTTRLLLECQAFIVFPSEDQTTVLKSFIEERNDKVEFEAR